MGDLVKLFQRVLDALLREGWLGDGHVSGGWWTNGRLRIAVCPDGYQHLWRSAEPWFMAGDEKVDSLDRLLEVLAPQVDPEAVEGWAAFARECEAEALARRLAPSLKASGEAGMAGAVEAEAVAALADHPVYPTSRARLGLTPQEIVAYAPEHKPVFALRWLHCPNASITGRLPGWWPDAQLIAAHPLTVERLGLPAVDGPQVLVRPTLSMRTVSLVDDPYTHVKLPLATATLGARNRRTLAPGTLVDGAVMQRFLEEAALPFGGRILHADESTYGHDGDETRAFLIRRYPATLSDATVLPVAGLARLEVLDDYLDLLVEWHVYLWLRHGVALEAHQQNIHIVLPPDGPLCLLYKDNDGARVDPRLGLPLDDPRMVITDESELADVFTTITIHLAAAGTMRALGVSDPGPALRRRIIGARDRWGLADHRSELLTERVLEADHLPIKAMVTAGTLLPKQRLGCSDINKHYLRTGPNYLRAAR